MRVFVDGIKSRNGYDRFAFAYEYERRLGYAAGTLGKGRGIRNEVVFDYKSDVEVNWKTSGENEDGIRYWLNNYFYNTAFSFLEKAAMLTYSCTGNGVYTAEDCENNDYGILKAYKGTESSEQGPRASC